jgi:hypothetical protein
MTAAELHRPPRAAPATSLSPAVAGLRLTWLHLISRRAPVAFGLLAGLGVLLWIALSQHWNIAGGRSAQELISLTVGSAAAAIVAVTTYGPFGEQERPTGGRMPWLRLTAVVLVTAVAVGALAVGAPGGTLAMIRTVLGTSGIGLLCAVALGGAFGWTGPLAYLLITEVALTGNPTTPWVWAARPPDDLGAALCAYGVFAAGVVTLSVFGARGPSRLRS